MRFSLSTRGSFFVLAERNTFLISKYFVAVVVKNYCFPHLVKHYLQPSTISNERTRSHRNLSCPSKKNGEPPQSITWGTNSNTQIHPISYKTDLKSVEKLNTLTLKAFIYDFQVQSLYVSDTVQTNNIFPITYK